MTNSHNNITCPKCHSAFPIDKSDYALISQQVRTKEFNSELEKKVKSEVSQFKKIIEHELSSKFNTEINEKNKIDFKQNQRSSTNLASKRPIQNATETLDIEPLEEQDLVQDNKKSEKFEIDDPW